MKDRHFGLEPLTEGRVFRIVCYYEGYSSVGGLYFIGQEVVSRCVGILFSCVFDDVVRVSAFSEICSHSLAVEVIFIERGANPSDAHELSPWRIV